MVTTTLLREVQALPPGDRLDLIGQVWDTLAATPADHEVREAQLGLALHRAHPEDAVNWDTAMDELVAG